MTDQQRSRSWGSPSVAEGNPRMIGTLRMAVGVGARRGENQTVQ